MSRPEAVTGTAATCPICIGRAEADAAVAVAERRRVARRSPGHLARGFARNVGRDTVSFARSVGRDTVSFARSVGRDTVSFARNVRTAAMSFPEKSQLSYIPLRMEEDFSGKHPRPAGKDRRRRQQASDWLRSYWPEVRKKAGGD